MIGVLSLVRNNVLWTSNCFSHKVDFAKLVYDTKTGKRVNAKLGSITLMFV